MANRAFVLAALTKGKFEIHGDFWAEDIQHMIHGLTQFGLYLEQTPKGFLCVNDLRWMNDPQEKILFLGNSGTSLRFLTSLACLRSGDTQLSGVERMHERPIRDLVDALRKLGFPIDYLDKEGFPPLEIIGSDPGSSCPLEGGKISMRADTSSQFLSSLLLIASSFEKGLQVEIDGDLISRPYVETTLQMIREWGGKAEWEGDVIHVFPAQLEMKKYLVEGDASAAVYWWAWGFLHDVKVDVKNVPLDSVQGDVKFLQVLDLLKAFQGDLFEIDMNDLPDASLMLMAMAPILKFPLRITNVASLRVKETDRIEAMATELRKVASKVETGEDWMQVWPIDADSFVSFHSTPDVGLGTGRNDRMIQIETYQDHRIAMSFAILNTKLHTLEILDPDCVKKTYPNFWRDLPK